MRKKKKKSDKVGAPAWMVTYGDMMSLLLTFFVLLVSMSSIQESKFRQALGSLLGALGVMRMDSSIIEMENERKPKDYESEVERIREEFKRFEKFVRERRLDDAIEVTETDEGMLVRMKNPILFDTGKAGLKPMAYDVMNSLAEVLGTVEARIRIEGHTDNVPIHNERFPSNWELSATRAVAVLKFFHRSGFPGTKLTAVGHGEYRPLVDNDTPENRGRNRRVEISVDYKEDLERKTVRSLFHNGGNKEGSDG